MHITRQHILEFFRNPDNLFFLWDENDTFPALENIKLLDHVAIIFTLRGGINFSSILKKRRGDADHLVIANDTLCGTIINTSEDFKSEGILISKEIWDSAIVRFHPGASLSMASPTLKITAEQKAMLIDFLHIIKDVRKGGRPDSGTVMMHLVTDLMEEISKIYEHSSTDDSLTSKHFIMRDFSRLLSENFRTHRDVEFYADALHLQKRHLSAVIKQTSGMTAFKCIQMHVLIQASNMLRQTEMSIKEISMDLNFDDTSHFCKYFKKHVGMTPETYRRSRF